MLIDHIKGKHILFFSPEFFSIDKNIIKVLEENKAYVTWYDERSVKSAFGRAVNSIFPKLFTLHANHYYHRILNSINYKVDIVLVIKGDMISKKTISAIRNKFPNAEIILYLYDSVNNIKNIEDKFELYDRVFSFEKADCNKYGFEFRPLFCSIERDIVKSYIEPKHDICFYGTMYGDRFSVVEQMKRICEKDKISFYSFCFLRGKFMSLYYYITNSGFRRLGAQAISYKPKSMKEIADIVSESKAILDINDIHQSGLTNRTLETLISGKKLITTNASIKEYDLYNESNVCVIDRNHVKIEKSFLNSDPIKLPNSITDKYTAEGWVSDVFK